MKNAMGRIISLIVVIFALVSLAVAQATPTPDPEQEMNSRFSKAVGVPLDKFMLHYYLVKNGGVVELVAKDPSDTSTIEAIQKYLQLQKELWEKGKETVVTDIHGKFPEPAATMKKLRNEITFYMAKTDNGGVLRMFSINDQARAAIQDYLKFEITEHKTGDSPTIDQ